jgi:hypothetical protein
MPETMRSVKNDLFRELIMVEELLDYLHHFFISPGKTRASKANSDLRFVVFHEFSQITVPKLTIMPAVIRKKAKNVVKFASEYYVISITMFFS